MVAKPDHMVCKISFLRLLDIAKRLGSQDTNVCPSDDKMCFNQRGIDGYLDKTADNECANCWARFLVNGD